MGEIEVYPMDPKKQKTKKKWRLLTFSHATHEQTHYIFQYEQAKVSQVYIRFKRKKHKWEEDWITIERYSAVDKVASYLIRSLKFESLVFKKSLIESVSPWKGSYAEWIWINRTSIQISNTNINKIKMNKGLNWIWFHLVCLIV